MPLRVLDACIEEQSFEKAAAQLDVPLEALTHQITAIEAWVGAPLFRRGGGARLIATEATLYAKAILGDGFGRQRSIPALLGAAKRADVVSVSTAPTFASSWLLPRLERFRDAHPNIDVWISVEMRLVDFSVADADIAIRYGAGGYSGLVAEKLFDDTAVVLGAAEAIAAHGPITNAADLASRRLLEIAAPGEAPLVDWPMWFAARGVRHPPPPTRCNSIADAMNALGAGAVALSALAAGAPAPGSARIFRDATPLAHRAVWPSGKALSAPAELFLRWLRSESSEPGRPAREHPV